MGNCVEAMQRRKTKQVEITVKEMMVNMETQIKEAQARQERQQHHVNRYQQLYDNLCSSIRVRRGHNQPTHAERKQLLSHRLHMAMHQKLVDQYEAKVFELETQRTAIEEFGSNTTVLVKKRTLAKGLKDLKKLGIDVSKAERQADSETDAAEDIEELNRTMRGESEPVFTEEQKAQLAAEIDSDFQGPPVTLKAPKVPTRKLVQDPETVDFEIKSTGDVDTQSETLELTLD